MSRAAQPDLFTYPNAPGFKARGTSEAAAKSIAAKERPLRERVLEEIRRAPGTPEQIALRLREPLMNVRPRCSQLKALGLIKDSGGRGTAMGGCKAIVWMATPEKTAAEGVQ